MARRRSYGPYRMTPRRRYALKKAQEASARKRKRQRNKKIGIAAGAIAGIAVAGVLGSRYGSSRIQQSVKNKRVQAFAGHRGKAQKIVASRRAVQPSAKESVRVANAVSVAPPSRTTITDADRLRAQHTRDKLKKQSMPPMYDSTGKNIGGPDRRSYDAEGNVRSEAQTNRSVRQTLKAAKKNTQGKKTSSLKGTPGGTKTPMKAVPHKPETWKDEDWADALAFDTSVRQPIAGPPAQRKSMSTSVPQRDPLHTLAKKRFEDSKLLGAGNKVSGADDPFLANVGTSRKAGRKPKRK